MAQFLMNTMMAAGGYPWTVIPLPERKAYKSSLEKASVREDSDRLPTLWLFSSESVLPASLCRTCQSSGGKWEPISAGQ
jgi:hypothetical protein